MSVQEAKQRFQHFTVEAAKSLPHIFHHKDGSSELLGHTKSKFYIPTTTGRVFHEDQSFVQLVMGPYNSGKSSMCLHKIVREAGKMPAWDNGRRRAKCAIIRNTAAELVSTTLQTWLTWFSDLGHIKKRQKPLLTYQHEFNDGDGIIDLELLFIALDSKEDVRKIKSLEATFAYLNELSEIPEAAFMHIKGRVNRRYPSRAFCSEPYWSGVIADTNPPEVDHWIYRDFEQVPVEGYRLFKQPPGLLKDEHNNWFPNPSCDNYINMAPDYYTKLALGNKEDFIKVYCLGEYGTVDYGKLVFTEYNDALHGVSKLQALQGEPIHLFWDFGLTPCCLVLQFTERGQLRALKEYTSENLGIRTFASNIVIPALHRDFPYCKIGISRADPSGMKKDEIMEELSCIGELNSLGIDTQAARTNEIAPRLASVRFFLNRLVDGHPGFQLNKEQCPMLRRGFMRDYVYKRVRMGGDERYREIPHKNEVSEPHDCLQYGALEFAAERILQDKTASKTNMDMYNPGFRWTN